MYGARLGRPLNASIAAIVTVAALAIQCDSRPAAKNEIVRIDSPIAGLRLALHHHVSASREHQPRRVVLFAEGSAVPTSGNADFKIDGTSWMDNLADAGFDVWSLDYLGYGESSRYRESDLAGLPGRASDCATQVVLAVQFILQRQKVSRLSLIGDSFGSLVAGIYATLSPETIDKLILFAPVTPSAEGRPNQTATDLPKFHLVTPDDLWELYLTWLPKGESVGLNRDFFVKAWGAKYLDSDPSSKQRTPPSVIVPAGPDLDTIDIQRGQFPYDPGRILAPTLVIFGEWDSVATEEGGKRLFDLLTATRHKRRIVIGRGSHVLQLEVNRHVLYREVELFLAPALTRQTSN